MDKEFKLLKKYFAPLSKHPGSENLSNDAAILRFKNENSVVSSDMMIEDIHFTSKHNPRFIAQKLLRINLSDLAAMGAIPHAYILNIALPPVRTSHWVKEFVGGLKVDQEKFNIELVGGDLSRASKIFLSITIIGKIKKKYHSNNLANVGSSIYLSNFIGDSAIGLKIDQGNTFEKMSDKSKKYFTKKFFLPIPRIELGQKLLSYSEVCTDISDGLIRDLNKLCYHSKLGANIYFSKIPLSIHAKKILKQSSNKNSFWETILCGGEDYELLFSVNQNKEKRFLKYMKKNVYKVGNFCEGSSINIFDVDGKMVKLTNNGFSHF